MSSTAPKSTSSPTATTTSPSQLVPQPGWLRTTTDIQSPAAVRVKNLQTPVVVGPDAWGRYGRQQPLRVTASVFFLQPFAASSSTDTLASDTVHYGILAKTMLATLHGIGTSTPEGTARIGLAHVMDAIWQDLTGFNIAGTQSSHGSDAKSNRPLLDVSAIKGLQITLNLPKASLVGDGVSVTCTHVFQHSRVAECAIALKFNDLKVPTLIGVNSNERGARQAVVANVSINSRASEPFDFHGLEAVIIKEMSESSCETLEALALALATELTRHLRLKYERPTDGSGFQLSITLEKPIAIVLADASCVELRVNTNDVLL